MSLSQVTTMKKTDWKTNSCLPTQWFGNSSVWLLAIFSGLFLIHTNLVLKANDGSLAGSSLLYWIAIGSMIWSRRRRLKLESYALGTFLGSLLLSIVLIKSAFIQGYDPFLRVLPFLATLATGILASGIRGLHQFWKELTIFAFLAPPPGVLEKIIDTSAITAKFSTAMLWYSGFDVNRQGTFIFIPKGGVEVYSGCSGVDTMLHLLGLSIVFLAMFPTPRKQQFVLPIISLIIAFVINAIRVAVMAILSEPINKSAFEYWHKGDGSLLFSMFAVIVLGIYCFFILKPDDSTPESISSENS